VTDVAIVGAGQSEFARPSARTAWQLALDASLDALSDAGVDAAEIDGVCRFAAPFEPVSTPMLVRGLGIPELSFFAEFPLGGEALGGVIAAAVDAIKSGQASTVLVFRSLSQSIGGRFGRADQGAAAAGGSAGEDIVVAEAENRSFSHPYGMVSPGNLFAMWVTRYMHVHGVSFEDMTTALGTIALTQRRYANTNPNAIMRDRTLDWATYRSARFISWPLRLYDFCLENDGAVAFVLTSAERAKGLSGAPVRVLATTQSLSPYHEPFGLYTYDDMLNSFPPEVPERLYRDAGIVPSRLKVAELYDAVSFMTLKSLEGYRIAETGQGGRYVTEVGTGPDSPLPVNTHGGHLSEGYLHGMNAILEAVRQIRGTAANPVPGADVALVGAPSGSAAILAV
jgi:acetyl-CoA acetyltransferase